MECITRYDFKFGDIIIPKRTVANIISPANSHISPNTPGLHVILAIYNRKFLCNDINNEFKVKEKNVTIGDSSLSGVLISTNTENIFIDYKYNCKYSSLDIYP